MPPAAPSVPHTAARALFAQECTHDTHYLNHKGDLYTALITGGDRVLMLKNGTVVAQSGPLFDASAACQRAAQTSTDSAKKPNATSTLPPNSNSSGATAGVTSDVAWPTPRVYVVCICRFTDDVLRLAVATTTGIFVFEFDDAGLLWQDTRPSAFWRTADRDGEDGVFNAGSPISAASQVGSPTGRYPAVHGRGAAFQPSPGSPLGLRGATAGATAGGSSSPTSANAGHEKHSGMTGRLRWRRVAFSLDPPAQKASSNTTRAAAAAKASVYRGSTLSSLSSNSAAVTGGGGNGGKTVVIAPVRVAVAPRPSAVRAMDFVSEDALCVVLDTETVLLMLGNCTATASSSPYSAAGAGAGQTAAPHVPDRVVWRSLGAYRSLAVCRVNHHVALALGHSSIVVFPSRVLSADGQDSAVGLSGDDDASRSSAAFSTATSSFFATKAAAGDASMRCLPGSMAGAMRGMLSDSRSSSVVPTPAFSPTNHPFSVPVLPSGGLPHASSLPAAGGAAGVRGQPYITLAKQGLTTSVGIYHITDMRWHRVSSHTLLCVTCAHPHEEASFMMLYTVQSLSITRRYTNVMEEHADGGWGLCRGGYDGDGVMDGAGVCKTSENIVQLVPAGVIALTYVPTPPVPGPTPCTGNTSVMMTPNTTQTAALPNSELPRSLNAPGPTPERLTRSVSATASTTWGGAQPPPVAEMHTSLVPNFSRSAEANSMGSRMEFLHVEGDGTVRTSSYSFGRQKHASFAKQRAVGLACTKLLQPLLHLYGSLLHVTVLPAWRTRPMELGHHTGKQPQAVELMLNASRRYRLVLRFTSGVVLAAMVDLSAAVYRVESYLALGKAPLLSLRPISPVPELDADAAEPPLSQPAIGTTTMLLVGLLGYPVASSPPAGKPKRLLTSSPSFLEDGELDAVKEATHSRSSSCGSTASLSKPYNVAPAAAPPRTVWGVALLQVEPSGLQARVLTIAPLSDAYVAGVSDIDASSPQVRGRVDDALRSGLPQQMTSGAASGGSADASAAAAPPAAVTEEDVADFMKEKCPEKLKFMPALLKATQQDAGKLLTQLIVKYGALERASASNPVAEDKSSEKADNIHFGVADTQIARPASALPFLPSPSLLSAGCVTEDGEVVLLLTAHSEHTSFLGSDSDNTCDGLTSAPAALVRIRPPCVEAFAPVQKLVAAGSSQVPFVAMSADYVNVPAALQQRWAAAASSQRLVPHPTSTSTSPAANEVTDEASADAQCVRSAFRLCRRVLSRLAGKKRVQCEVVYRDSAVPAPHIRVRSPLSPDGQGETRLTSLQYLPLPADASSTSPATVEEVKGTLEVNNDVVVAVLCRTSPSSSLQAPSSSTPSSRLNGAVSKPASPPLAVGVAQTSPAGTLYLYGCPAVQSLAASTDNKSSAGSPTRIGQRDASEAGQGGPTPTSAFVLEATLTGVEAFYLSTSGEVVVLRDTNAAESSGGAVSPSGLRFERWLRCFPGASIMATLQPFCPNAAESQRSEGGTSGGYFYQLDPMWCPPCTRSGGHGGELDAVTAVTTMEVAGAWEANVVGLSAAAKLSSSRAATRPVLYAMADNAFIRLRQIPLRSGGDTESRSKDATKTMAGTPSASSAAASAALPQYHPDAIMQLIGMARWSVLAKVLTLVLNSAKTVLATSLPTSSSEGSSHSLMYAQPPDELARRLCTSAVARGFHDRPQVVQYDDVLYRVTPPRLSAAALQDDVEAAPSTNTTGTSALGGGGGAAAATQTNRLYDLTATCGTLFAELTEVLPQVTLTGLSSQEQLTLLCILQALRDTLPLSRSVDEAAARYLFFTRLMSLGRRLRLPNIDLSAAGAAATAVIPGVPINSVLYFEVGRTATRAVSTAAYLWAAMSDSQSTLVSLLFDKTSAVYLDGGSGSAATSSALGGGEVTWEQVEQSGAAFWVRSAADLRVMADRVARHQYQRTKELTACALMYCTARKVGTLAALAKAQNNLRLHAFFSRDFANDEHHRAAASANAYAAISKNMPQYGAAFFLLAGDVRSAVQVLLQRCHDPFLALFVLRAAGEGTEAPLSTASPEAPNHSTASLDGGSPSSALAPTQKTQEPSAETLLQWYVKQRAVEVEVCGPLDMWETACLSWVDVTPQTSPEVTVLRRIAALQRIAAHPTAHPEALCALRYARDGVAALAYRGHQFLSPAHEVICLLRLGRFCLAHRLHLNGYLHYRNAEALLDGLRAEATRRKKMASGDAGEEEEASFGPGLRGGLARRRPAPPKMAADFNTGTLTFRGFDSDDDDDDASIDKNNNNNNSNACPSKVDDEGQDDDTFVLSDEADAAVQAEVQYAYIRSGARAAHRRSSIGDPLSSVSAEPGAASYEDVLRRMLLCFTSASSFMSTSSVVAEDAAETVFGAVAGASGAAATSTTSSSSAASQPASQHGPFQSLLSALLRRLLADMPGDRPAETGVVASSMSLTSGTPRKSSSPAAAATAAASSSPLASSGSTRPVLNCSIREPLKCAVEGWYSLCIPLLHLLLSKVALQEANYLVLLSLQRIPVSTEGVLEAAEHFGLLSEIFDRAAAASGVASPGSPAMTPGAFLAHLSPLYLPLMAFFRLLGRHVMQHYKEACEAEEARLGGAAALRDGRVKGAQLTSGAAEADDGASPAGENGDAVHQNMFEALMAAAAAAERSNTASGASSPGPRDGARRPPYFPFDGEDGTSNAVEGADDEDLLSGGAGPSRSAITEEAQVAFLLSCCQSQLQLRLMEHLRHLAKAELQTAVHTPTTQRALDAGILYSDPLTPPAQAMLIQRRILLCTMLLDVTAQWSALSEETMLRLYAALPRYAPGPLTDPNGVFLEVRLDVIRMRAVLVSLLAGPGGIAQAAARSATSATPQKSSAPLSVDTSDDHSTTTWLEENTVMLLELCTTHLEVFWTLPSLALTQCRQLAAPTRAALRLLHKSTTSHTTARRLFEGMLRPAGESPAVLPRSHTAPLTSSSSVQHTPSASRPASPLARATTSWSVGFAPSERGASRVADTPDGEAYCPALCFLQLAWMRRHHTHALLRWLLLGITLDMGRDGGQRPLLTDRLILTQHSHAVTGVQFDASSCDSVVCTTEAGTSVGHGFRELLAGDNEEALWSQSTERNLATAAFTLGLTAQQERLQLATEHSEGTHTPQVVAALAAKAVLESRPRCAVAANAMPSSHPHLPFFLSRHRDGHLDLYPFASQECLASFCCALRHGQIAGGGTAAAGSSGGVSVAGNFRASAPTNTWGSWGLASSTATAGSVFTGFSSGGSGGGAAGAPSSRPASPQGPSIQRMERHAVTPVAFSPNGYIIAAGLSDGSVAGWRFAAAAVESAPAFAFPQLFAPFGIRACAFCGDRSSLLVVVGLAKEPHPHPRGRLGGASTSARATGAAAAGRGGNLSTSFALSPTSPSGVLGGRAGSCAAAADQGEMVGEVLILDTMLDAGAVTARCALPFVPSYAVYLTPLRAVLMVSSEGLMATYAVPSGRLAVLATLPISAVLHSLMGASLGENGAAATGTSAAAAGGADAGAVYVTCVARSAYDPLIALGTSRGVVLLLHLRHISAAMQEAERRVSEEGDDVFVYYPSSSTTAQGSGGAAGKRRPTAPLSTPVSATSRAAAEVAPPVMGVEFMKRLPQESVLMEATCVQVAPQMQSRSAVEDIVFTPSMLLAGLRDGKVMAAAIIAQATRTRLTAGCEVPVELLEVREESVA